MKGGVGHPCDTVTIYNELQCVCTYLWIDCNGSVRRLT